MRRSPAFTAVALSLMAISAGVRADVWKWVDASGQAQYSDRWVPGAQLIKSDHPHETVPGAADGQKNLASMNERAATQLSEQSAAAAVRQDVTNARTEQCKQAKERYDKMIEARRLFRPGKDGEREYLSDEEADQMRVQARMDMQQACGSAPAK
ncbi:MAG TPA: DUF4124 domain-containing protein [Steroidobacteraceae bacterium]|nr:DUF4124 domain-containing protein [Steroidobacteraceae bacterium]